MGTLTKSFIIFLGIHFWILSTICLDGRCPYFHEMGTVSLNVAHLSTFVACNVHAITFPFRRSQQRLLLIAWLCRAIFYLNSLLFRFWCMVCARWLYTVHYILPLYNGPQFNHQEQSFMCRRLCVARCCVCVFGMSHPVIIAGCFFNHMSSFIQLVDSAEFSIIAFF